MDLRQAIDQDDVLTVESIIKKELDKNKQNIQLWFKLCLTELQFPLEDYESALKCIDEVYKISSNDLDALILETGIKWHSFGFIEEELFVRLCNINSNDIKKMSIVYYLQSLYYRFNKDIKNEKLILVKSIDLYDKFVYPNKALGHILLAESNVVESKKMFKIAVSNVQKVYREDDFYDFTDIETYISEFITGTAISDVNYKILKELAKE